LEVGPGQRQGRPQIVRPGRAGLWAAKKTGGRPGCLGTLPIYFQDTVVTSPPVGVGQIDHHQRGAHKRVFPCALQWALNNGIDSVYGTSCCNNEGRTVCIGMVR